MARRGDELQHFIDAGYAPNDWEAGQTGKVADYGLVGDLFEILPELKNAI